MKARKVFSILLMIAGFLLISFRPALNIGFPLSGTHMAVVLLTILPIAVAIVMVIPLFKSETVVLSLVLLLLAMTEMGMSAMAILLPENKLNLTGVDGDYLLMGCICLGITVYKTKNPSEGPKTTKTDAL